MRIAYVAKHGSGGADDEGAILHALRQLGHHVTLSSEDGASKFGLQGGHDLLLFHKWDDVGRIDEFDGRKVFWYFDLVDWPQDPSLYLRCKSRRAWMERVIPHVDLGFCTDGDWVDRVNDQTRSEFSHLRLPKEQEPLVWLPQGADERVVGRGDASKARCGSCDILFTGMRRNCGAQRWSFCQEMEKVWGNRFKWIERGLYGRELADQIAASKVIVAPDSPVTDRYWSNRIYVSLGFGAFLLHPWTQGLDGVYDFAECRIYRDRDQLHKELGWMLSLSGGESEPWRECSVLAIKEKDLYRHRCEELIRVVKERLP